MNAIKEAHYNLGIAYLEAEQHSRAIPEFEAAIALDANFIGAHCALCRAYLKQGELEKAGTAVTAALKLDGTHQPTLLLHGTIIEAYHDKGVAYLGEKRYTEAVAAFQKAIDFDANVGDSPQTPPLENTHIHVHLGAAYIGMKAYQSAIDALQKAIAVDPGLVDAHYHLGYVYVEQGCFDKAIPPLERAIAIAPHLKRAHYNLARAYQESGNLEAATHTITETLRLDPNYQRARELADTIKQGHYNRGIADLNDERYSEAVTAFRNVITFDPDFTTAHYNLGLAYLKMETYPRAVEALERTIGLDSTYKAAHHALALAYFGQRELGKARGAAREALRLDANYQPARSLLEAIDPSFTPSETETTPSLSLPAHELSNSIKPVHPPQRKPPIDAPLRTSDAQKHYERGKAFLNTGQYNQAAAAFKKVIDADPSLIEAYYGLGQAYLEVRAFDDAKAAAEEVLVHDPNHRRARELLQIIKFARNLERNGRIRKKFLSYTVVLGVTGLVIFILFRFGILPWPPFPSPLPFPIPPDISMVVSLEEPSGNRFLDADETGRIRLIITNKGGTARNVELRLAPLKLPSLAGLRISIPTLIPELSENSVETVRITVKADRKIKGRDQSMRIQLFGEDRTLLATTDFSFKIIPLTPGPILPRR